MWPTINSGMVSNWILFAATTWSILINTGQGRTCTSSDDLGNSNYNSLTGRIDTTTETQFVMTDNEYISPCCGFVTSWNIYAGNTGNIVFQVFRPNAGGTQADLVGENAVTVSSTGQFVYTVPTTDQIEIEEDDIIGWYSFGTEIIEYKRGGNRNDNNYVEDIAQPSIGDTVTYTNQEGDRTYAIYATLDALSPPALTNLDDTVNQYQSLVTTGTSMFTVTSSSATAIFDLQSISPFSHFDIDATTGEVTSTVSSVTATTYTLTITAVDTCSDTSTGTLTIVISNTAPVWSNLDASFSVPKSSLSTSIATYTVSATNPDLGGSPTYTLQSITPQSHFTVHAGTGDVTASTSSVTEPSYTIVIRASDVYGNYVDGTLTLSVVNVPPEIVSLPDVADVSESAVDETLLHTVNVTDVDGDVITCAMTASPSGPFITKYLTVNGVLTTGIYLQASSNLDYAVTNTYELSVECTDASASDTEILYVYVIANNVPQITNLQNTASILSSTPSTSIIFTVLSTDVEGDATFFTLTCLVASPCPFSIYSDGSVVLTTSLVSTTTNGYELDVSVRDAYTTSGTHRLTVFVTDLNTNPQLNNLPTTIQLPEDTSVGTTVFQVSVYDEDGDSSHTFSSSFSPVSSAALFLVNSTTGAVVITTALNYQTQANSYTITIEASDAQTTSTSQDLSIEVVDVNQAPVLYQTNYQVDVEEGSAGTSVPDPDFNVDDPDSDEFTFSWGGGSDSSGFAINTTNGVVSFTIDYDVEDTSIETHYEWLIVISDPEGLAATATLTLSILDANDNVPKFESTNYATVVYNTAKVGESVLTTTSTDADITEDNRELDYSIHNTDLFKVDHSGVVFVYADLETYVDTTETFTIRVKNPSPNSFDTAYFAIAIVKEEDNDGFFDDTANIIWVTLVCIFGPVVLIGAAYLCYLAYQKWAAAPVMGSKPPVTQVAPYDTRIASPPPYTPPKSRASLMTRGSAVTPTDVRVISDSWEGWKASNWQP